MRKFYPKFYLTAAVFLLGIISCYGQLNGQLPLNPKSIPQFVDPLPHFAGQRLDAKEGGSLTVTMKPIQQIIVSTGTLLAGGLVTKGGTIGLANLWAYELQYGTVTKPASWPAFTIEAQRGKPLSVTYVNALTGPLGVGAASYSDVGLIVDQTLHWADPMMSMGSFDPYVGEPPTTVHLHGGEVPPLSDGGPDSWFTPGNASTGHSFNSDPYIYPNTQEAATLWFHDHALGVTRLNVYAGMAGFYFLRDGATEDDLNLPGWSGDNKVQEATGGFQPAAYLPEIEIAIQDRMLDTYGKLYFPNLPTNPFIHPTWTPEFVGDIITVNGKTWPYLSVAPRKYRFRILNGSNARTYELWLQDLATGASGPIIYQIGTDGGLLDAPVSINPALGGKLILMPGERADVVIDFSGSQGAVWTMRNSGKTPYPAGAVPKATTLGRIMQFVVNGTGTDNSKLPASLRPFPGLVKLTNFSGAPAAKDLVSKTRQLTLNEVMDMGGPLEVLVNNTKWGDNVTENPVEGTTELWQIINLTADAHPIHLHLVQAQLMGRQNFNTNNYNKAYNALFPGKIFVGAFGPPKPYDFYYNALMNTGWLGGNPDVTPYLQGPVKPANPNERGWKDTFVMYPGQVTTVIARWAPTDKQANTPAKDLWFQFDPSGHGYVWHCHIIDHEDNEMMRPYMVEANDLAVRTFAKGNSVPENEALKSTPTLNTDEKISENIDGVLLEQNYPNPFSGETQISFTLPEAAHIQLTLYNTAGLPVQTLIDAEAPAGLNTVRLDAGNLKGGIYFYQLNTGNITQVKKMIILE